MWDDNFEADKIRYLYNITKFGSDVSRKGGGCHPQGLKKIYQPRVVKIFLVPPWGISDEKGWNDINYNG